jgi:hypothetical protein
MHSTVLDEGRNSCIKSGRNNRSTGERRLTAALSDVGTDQAIGRRLIRTREHLGGLCGCLQGAVIAVSFRGLEKFIRTDTVKRAALDYDHQIHRQGNDPDGALEVAA